MAIKVTPQDIKDMSGNKATEAASVVYHKDSVIVEKKTLQKQEKSQQRTNHWNSNGSHSICNSTKLTATNQSLVNRNDQYELKVTADGKASFTLNGATAVSDKSIK